MGKKAEKSETDTLGFKIASSLVAIGAGWVAQKVVRVAWRKTTGHDAPESIDDDQATLAGVVAFAAISGAVAALTRALATRGTARAAHRIAEAKTPAPEG